MRILQAVVLVTLIGLMACTSQSEKSVRQEDPQEKPAPIALQGPQIAPGKCRIVGTVLAIDTALAESGPCSKVPCRAMVRVDSVLGYGSAFGNPIAIRKAIRVHFAFTLAPTTKDLFPAMSQLLPGLEIKSRFQADLETDNEMKTAKGLTWYLVYDYRKVN